MKKFWLLIILIVSIGAIFFGVTYFVKWQKMKSINPTLIISEWAPLIVGGGPTIMRSLLRHFPKGSYSILTGSTLRDNKYLDLTNLFVNHFQTELSHKRNLLSFLMYPWNLTFGTYAFMYERGISPLSYCIFTVPYFI